ncbi:MAG: hypothetical protein A2513_01795 [Sulfurimonas sp. RIFOXYD12_FULL_33_39]|uniref:hypothetical protein n=1 Tax=unclassified Sulfurimonas TaxID=2623549 RepID=UPI0008AC4C19|nr:MULTISPECIES: hypothetical protein [unclassified Sulfurimonas]OHE04870.1 MAG: hypothetical protein A3G74_02575 [Sulfurimonas sp. RIFCSPLOWO2_12_FULL_34_6]OHE08730.1 MAG: hypothetical protein A2513_01795 [Sulfurimonas sp. RIFOXYD12_FULL_33_39]OHE14015.1 MAG: hypothetical protein A2530_03120 [Sulfurimonas sp. RIFOXYD2_FULL_34_21]DAB28454.1 MAG TPA: hypothetical protein CFH78_02340 [Sulfurimonas sp. UBA10385]
MKKNITANTFTPIYDELEDRLRVVVNYEDIGNRVDFMITRNFILNLIPSAEEFILNYYSKEPMIYDSITVNPESNANENKVFSKTDAVNLELFRTEEELLLEVNFSFDLATKYTLLTLSSKNVSAKISLDSFMLQKIIHVIKSAIPFMKWGISRHF